MLKNLDRFLYGLVVPLGLLVIGLLLVMSLPSGAAAAEYASLGVFLGAIIIGPVVLIVNAVLAWGAHENRRSCLIRGMMVPGLVLITALAYQLGLLDTVL